MLSVNIVKISVAKLLSLQNLWQAPYVGWAACLMGPVAVAAAGYAQINASNDPSVRAFRHQLHHDASQSDAFDELLPL